MIKLLSAPIRKLLKFPLVQFAIVVFLILVMQAADEQTMLGKVFNALDKIVDDSVRNHVGSFSRSNPLPSRG